MIIQQRKLSCYRVKLTRNFVKLSHYNGIVRPNLFDGSKALLPIQCINANEKEANGLQFPPFVPAVLYM